MKKRLFKIVAVILAVAFVLPGQTGVVKADAVRLDPVVIPGGNVTYTYDPNMDVRKLTVTGEGVVGQMEGWEELKTSVGEIEIGEGITEIADNAFIHCTGLKKLVLPESLETIGDYAFSCNYKTQLPDGKYADKNNNSLEKLNIPSGVRSIGDHAFENYYWLTELNLPEGLEKIGNSAFSRCIKLRELELPSGVKSVGSSAFSECSILSKVTLPEGMESLGSDAFGTCDMIDRVTLPASLTELGDYVFHKNTLIFCKNAEQVQYCEKRGYVYADISKGLDINDTIMFFQDDTFPKSGVSGFAYTGSAIRPKVTARYYFKDNRSELLEENVHYTVTYTNNTNYGKATATIHGRGLYRGEKTEDFYIYKPVDSWDVSLEYESVLYDGTAKTPVVTVRADDEILVKDRDYEVAYENNVEEGLATVTITGKEDRGYMVLDETKRFIIYKGEMSDCTATLSFTETPYDGKEKKPAVTVRDKGGNLLKESVDYKVTYSGPMMYETDLTNAGRKMIKIEGMGSYQGQKRLDYLIQPVSIEGAEVTLEKTTFAYDGSPKRPKATVKVNGKVLTQFQDYSLTYKNNVEVGTAQAIIEAYYNYSGKVTLNFTIALHDDSEEKTKTNQEPTKKNSDSVQKGKSTYTSKNLIYKIVDQNKEKAEVVGASKQNISKLVVPATVTLGGKKYKVTSIGKRAFYKNTKLKSVVIGKNVTSIKDSAFYGCKKLKTITLKADRVVTLSDNAIKGISKNAVIKVSKKLVKKYQKQLKSKSGFKKTMKIKKK